MLQIRLLGQFDVRASGKRIDIPSRAGQSLLAYLLLNAGTPQRRERLAGLLWPDTSDENARHNLRTELWRIRKALGSRDASDNDYLLSEELTITFNPEAQFWLDVNQLQRRTSVDSSLDDLIGQLTLYQGELVPGFYDDWIVLERERLQALFERDMKCLMERLCQEQRWTTVLEWSERWIALGQTPEPAYRALMAAYAALGDHAKAVATFKRCQTALEQDLGVEPSAETQALYQRLLNGEAISSVDLAATQVAAVRARHTDEPPAPGDPPFKGLQYFDEGDADLFFGRELLTAQLIQHLRESNFLAVIVGASGSGKSSIVRAGLIPALKKAEMLVDGTLPPEGSRDWRFEIITPTAHPLEALAIALTHDSESVTATATLLDDLAREPRSLALFSKRLLHANHAPRLLLVIDQFEELFTLCRDEFEREAFIDNLLSTLTPSPLSLKGRGDGGEGPVTLILTLRADFYAHLAQYPELRDAVARQQEYIGPMTADELRRAIEEPAKRGGWEFEPGLVDLILRDVGDEPGALPLLSHALLETWQRRSGRTMTLKGYADSGGVRGAIAYTAESVYQQLSTEQQDLARHIFLELTELGEGTEDTRRRIRIDEVVAQSDQVRPLLTTLADARLITTDEETVEVAHEALIREWPRLRDWLNEDREGLRLHRQLGEAVHDWELLERDAGALYRGARLSQANEWAAANENALSASERAFLAASNELEQREAAEREAQRQRELQAALTLAETQQQAALRLRRRNRVIIGAGLMALLLAVLAGLFGIQANQNAAANATLAVQNASIASTAAAAAQTAQQQARLAVARQLIMQSRDILNTNWDVALLLNVEANRMADTAETRSMLLSNLEQPVYPESFWRGHSKGIYRVAFSPDGKTLASASADKTISLWDVSNSQQPAQLSTPLTGHADQVYCVAFSPDGKTLASGDRSGTILLWDVSDPRAPKQLGAPLIRRKEPVYSIAFNSDGTILASSSGNQTISLWDVSNPQAVKRWGEPLAGHTGPVMSVAFSPDGKTLASGSRDQLIRLWDVSDPTQPVLLSRPLIGNADSVSSVAFSRDGKLLVSGSRDRSIRLWDVSDPKQPVPFSGPLIAHADIVSSVTFSSDNETIASGDMDGAIVLWHVSQSQTLPQWGMPLTGHTEAIWDMAFSPDGKTLASGSFDDTVILWNVSSPSAPIPWGPPLAGHLTDVLSVAFSPDGKTLASGDGAGAIILWDVSNPRAPEQLGSPLTAHTDVVWSVVFSPDGKTLASCSADTSIILWDVSNPRAPKQLGSPLTAHTGSVGSLAFSPDGKMLASTTHDAPIILWDVSNPYTPVQLAKPLVESDLGLGDVVFSPDGKLLITATPQAKLVLWDVANPHAPVFLGMPLHSYTGLVASGILAFSPDGKMLASDSPDNTITLWDMDPISWHARACQIVRRNLTRQEWAQYFGDEPYRQTCEQWSPGE